MSAAPAAVSNGESSVMPRHLAHPLSWITKYVTILITLLFLGGLILVPALNVFRQAVGLSWDKLGEHKYAPHRLIGEIGDGIPKYVATFYVPEVKDTSTLSSQERRVYRNTRAQAEKTRASIAMTLGIVAVAVPLNVLFGVAAAWAVTKFRFPGRTFLVSIIDLPFAVSPVVAGMIFVLLMGRLGVIKILADSPPGSAREWLTLVGVTWVGAVLVAWLLAGIVLWAARKLLGRYPAAFPRWVWLGAIPGITLLGAIAAVLIAKQTTGISTTWLDPTEWYWPEPLSIYWAGFAESWWPIGFTDWQQGIIFTPIASLLATMFVTFPFIARSLIPLMQTQGVDQEQAALTLGASGNKMFWRVTLPQIKWALLYGIILCTARGVGEFGAVSVVSGHTDPNDTMPLRIEKLWQEYNTQGAFAVASILTSISLMTLLLKIVIERRTQAAMAESKEVEKS